MSLRSETDQVFANPDGTLTREQSLEPVRVRRGGAWKDVDSSLVRAADGSWGPAVGATPIAFSGGGVAPLVSMEKDGVRLSLSWPEPLPSPVVEGNEVTYPEVYPGVDLKMAAVGTSFTQRLVVKSRAAGVNPRVRALSLKASVKGGVLTGDGPGYVVKDWSGRAVLTGSQPVMWDNAAVKKSASVTEDLEDGDRQAPMGLSVSRSSMGLSANAALLDDPATVFPVVLDPTGSPAIYSWAMVNKSYPTTSYYNFTSADEGVGYNNFSGVHTKRVYYSFPNSTYAGKTIISAKLYAFETYSATCSAGTVNAYLTGDISSSTTWNNQPGKIGSVLDGWSTKAGRSDCYPGGKKADWIVTEGVKNRVAAGAARSTFVLQGASETTVSSWMRFAGPKNSTSSYRPTLSVTYNTTPSTVPLSSMWVPSSSKVCTSSTTGPSINPTVGASEAMSAKISDADKDSLTSQLQLSKGTTVLTTTDFTSRASGSVISKSVPSTLTNGTYRFRVRAKDALVWGAWSPYCYFTVDTTKPVVSVTSATWLPNTLAASTEPGSFVMSAPGATKIFYRWNSDPVTASKVPNTSGVATQTTTMTQAVDYWRAWASDAAGNTSATETYHVKRTQPAKLAQYLFNSGAPLADSETSPLNPGNPAVTEASAYTFDIEDGFDSFELAGRYDTQAALFDGSGTSASVPTRPVVSEESFAIGAWVMMSDRDQSRTLVAQLLDAQPADPASPRLAFDLGYDAALDKFVARVMNGSGVPVAQAIDALPSHLGEDPSAATLTRDGSWVYLAMVYDKGTNKLRLDANHTGNTDPPESAFSRLYPGTAVTVPGAVASSAGEFLIGAGSSTQGERAGWNGLVDNLAVWQGVPASSTILANANHEQ